MSLNEKLDAVVDSETFLEFVQALIVDREAYKDTAIDACGRNEGGWENHSIESFLEAATAWAEATNVGASQGLGNDATWKRFAVFLYCGKIYE